ncbi:MraY family glycosyltransferase [Sphingobacterium paludis]|uniref:UDP-N-acetylmuramyl pentapeptide phosphotransferase/UDP-N-acetylglucosamine-1-phosphate transferase n=1 Tax=Sphingobacterium paludis TaxID=1476465 RepID=A0A4R7D293_9SPHI|nr:glycosyltransferase family 4 protein [Sphingobacterium paludis]TDS13705.1 UDP-N-acetylmuramyl pentapeptide phosphotransferase/UDP-N-acetylglucosamine-1-phosphate transferase [Sphingobacterium paludis]
MNYAIVLLLLFVLEILYFRFASQFNIVDKPNQRSSHSTVTLRGGGIVFYFAGLAYFLVSGFLYPWFFLGLTLMTIVSFLDDVFTLSNKLRLLIHFSAVLLMAYELNVFEMPWYVLLITFIIIVGVINAYNFMDGINGITACYSLSIGALLVLANHSIQFIDQDLLIFTILSVLVFAFFNFRRNARCFAGDVGSVSIAFILLFALGALILKTGNIIYMLFLCVYGIDTVWTIIQRLRRGENIFKAHRSHLYQYLGNEAGVDKLLISFSYGMAQFLIGMSVLYFAQQSFALQILVSVSLLLLLSIAYLIGKGYIIKRYVR